MNSRRVQHSKYKNTGILFELLARQVTADTLNGRENSPAIHIIREYLRPSTELGKELVLYRSLMETMNISEPKALKLVDIVLEQRRKLSTKRLNEQKYNLVKAIKEKYPLKEFLSSKIPQYKVYASVYKTFLMETHEMEVVDINEITSARFTIVEHLMVQAVKSSGKQVLPESYKEQQEDLRLLTYKILVDKFNEKYKNLSEQQKVLLREYINNISNTNSLREYINSEVPEVKKQLQLVLGAIDDKVTRIKIMEVINQLNGITKGKTVRDNQVTSLMIAYQLVKEIQAVTEEE